jgi:glutamyl/glutaminyl-tRNA synthetase
LGYLKGNAHYIVARTRACRIRVKSSAISYRGRIAPSPTGFLHLGHAATFLTASHRCKLHNGSLLLRNDDLDRERVRPLFSEAALTDLRWLGIRWQEGPDVGGPLGPYSQSQRLEHYADAMRTLLRAGWVYPCACSRRDLALALSAPHASDEEPVYPGFCRPDTPAPEPFAQNFQKNLNWRFRIPCREQLSFWDGVQGKQSATASINFGDFLVWRKDGVPSYQLASAVDDALMGITEVVRGADLITSTFRQILVWRALNHTPPEFYHCPLLTDASGQRLAKRNDALSLRTLREAGLSPQDVRTKLLEMNVPAAVLSA